MTMTSPEYYSITEPHMMDAWISPKGEFHEVEFYGHSKAAREILGWNQDSYEDAVTTLEVRGWLHISGGYVMGTAAKEFSVSDSQWDVLLTLAKQARENTERMWGREFLQSYARIIELVG